MGEDKQTDYGRRDPRNEILRLFAGLVIVGILVVLELTVGIDREQRHIAALEPRGKTGWALKIHADPTGSVEIPRKPAGTKRILYLSNSHALTGGRTSHHLQNLLDRLVPGGFEVLDMSEPGIFAPDMLQRLLSALDYDLDLVILPVAYISFSDRMKLVRQSFSARSFFKPSVASRLPAGFWLRNYDLTLYTETLVARFLRLFRYRNDLRDEWETPIANLLKQAPGEPFVRFLEVDENQRWKFPEGFDDNLFDWSLYAVGREGHLADMRDLVETCARRDVPVLAANLPIHWDKDPHQADLGDYDEYRTVLARLFSETLEYADLQDLFPVEFSTYDALHPTWHGARLHALDLALRMNRLGLLPRRLPAGEIVDEFIASDSGLSPGYRRALSGEYPRLSQFAFRRYEIFEPDNARTLMRRLASLPLGSLHEVEFLYQLSRRLRYWQEQPFPPDPGTPEHWRRALESEMASARERAAFFQRELVRFQSERLRNHPIPDTAGIAPWRETTRHYGKLPVHIRLFRFRGGITVEQVHETGAGKVFSLRVRMPDGRNSYRRTDILGDRSFLLIQPYDMEPVIPEWVILKQPSVTWGT
jgi:hypothetical protein